VKRILETVAAVAVLATPMSAIAARVTVTDPWIRSLPASAAGYFTLRNDDSRTLTLRGAQSTACSSIMLHKSSNEGGMDSMSDLEPVKLAPHEIVKFAPGGYHLMCMDPRPEVKPGARVMITLIFDDHTGNPVSFAVKNAAGH
jgi:copper(I)-binding protein